MTATLGSAEDQMKTSLLAQLMSMVCVSAHITLMRMIEAMQTLRLVTLVSFLAPRVLDSVAL